MQFYSTGFPGLQLEGERNRLKPARLPLPAEPRSAGAGAAGRCCRGPACRSPRLPSWTPPRSPSKPWNVRQSHRRSPAVSQQSLAKTSEQTKLSIAQSKLLHGFIHGCFVAASEVWGKEQTALRLLFLAINLLLIQTKSLFSHGELMLLSCH